MVAVRQRDEGRWVVERLDNRAIKRRALGAAANIFLAAAERNARRATSTLQEAKRRANPRTILGFAVQPRSLSRLEPSSASCCRVEAMRTTLRKRDDVRGQAGRITLKRAISDSGLSRQCKLDHAHVASERPPGVGECGRHVLLERKVTDPGNPTGDADGAERPHRLAVGQAHAA